jgi:diguanylate cyclase (GGDEF)-like protein
MQISLNQRINRLFITLLVLTTVALLFFVWKSTSEQAKSQLAGDLLVAKNVLAKVLDDKEQQLADSTLLLTADWPFKNVVAGGDASTIQSALTNHGNRISADLMAIFSLEGELISAVPSTDGLSRELVVDKYVKESISDRVASSLLVIDGQLYQVLFATVKAPRPIAVAMTGFKIDNSIAEELKSITQLDTTIIVRADTQQFVISTLKESERLENTSIDEFSPVSWPLKALRSEQAFISTAFDLVDKEDLKVTIELSNDIETLLKDFINLQISFGLIAVLSVVIAIVFATHLSKKLIAPIQALTGHAKQIASGQYEEYKPIKEHSSELTTLSDAFVKMQANIQDREAKIVYQAQHDPLTTLFNRNHAEKLIAEKFSNNQCFQAIGINIVGFRGINDTFGYDNGDICLQTLAERVSKLGGLSARLTGGELLWAPDNHLSQQDLAGIKERLDGEINTDGLTIPMRVAMGIINCPSDTHSPSELFRKMNIVIDEAQVTRQFILPYSTELEEKYSRRLTIITELKQALNADSKALNLFYQPKLSLKTNRVDTAEALIRWTSDSLGFVSPEEFISIAEHAGFIGDVTEWVFKRAVNDIAKFKQHDIDITVALNISAQDVLNTELLPSTLELLEQHSLSPDALSFEMTEGQLVENQEKTISQLQLMRDAGFKIAIDDFGTGYSSLSYLSTLPADILKIDKSFVLQLDNQIADQTIVQTVVKLAHDFNMQVVAEGVENQASLELLRSYGCEFAQGYHICRPIDASNYIEWHQAHSASFIDEGKPDANS